MTKSKYSLIIAEIQHYYAKAIQHVYGSRTTAINYPSKQDLKLKPKLKSMPMSNPKSIDKDEIDYYNKQSHILKGKN